MIPGISRKLLLSSVVGVAVVCAFSARAYVLENLSWTRDRTVVFQLSLNQAHRLLDGSTSFNQVALAALNIWNPYLAHLDLTYKYNSPVPPAGDDDEMSVFFSSNVFGDSFDGGTLAITLLNSRNGVLEETDTIFNTAYRWDSYRGGLRGGIQDFRRVAVHEFGHSLGLDHPDEHGQHVPAIMNSHISFLETPQTDDINGARAIYNTGATYRTWPNASILRNLSTRGLIGTGDNVLIGGFVIDGTSPATLIIRAIGYSLRALKITTPIRDPMITLYDAQRHVVATNDDWFTSGNAQTIASYHLDPTNSIESALYVRLNPGAYTAVVQGFSGVTGVGLFELFDLHTSSSHAINISSRGQVLTGDNVLIAGFIIGGTTNKQVIVRAIGPSLATMGIAHPLADPTLELRNASGTLLQSNNNWQQQSATNAQAIAAHDLDPKEPRESAIFATLRPGSYTAIMRGVSNGTGTGLVEVYDVTQ